jgi:hypothetical protein
MSNSKSMERSVKAEQLKMRELCVDITAASSAVSGFDKNGIKEVVKNGAGDFTIVFKRPFNVDNANTPRAFITPMTAGVTSHLSASAHDRVTVVLSADVDFTVLVKGCDHRFNY